MIELKKESCEVFPIIIPNQSSLKTVNFFLVKHGNSLSLIDAGWNNDESWNGLIGTLSANGFHLEDLTEIILTHHHIDHVGLVNTITSQHLIPVYAHPLAIPRLKRDENFLNMRVDFFSQLYMEMGCGETGERQMAYLHAALHKNKQNAIQTDIVPIRQHQLLNWQVIEVPGHAPDQEAFYDKKNRWLFAGDLLIEHISSNALIEPDPSGKRIPSLSQHAASLKKCLILDIELLFPGHGGLIENPKALIHKRLERIEVKANRIIQHIRAGAATGSDIALAYYKNTYYEQFSLVMSEIIGHLDFLEEQGRIQKELVKGTWHYSVTEDK